jgi:hypothetical protein
MAAHLGQHAMEAELPARATAEDEAKVAGPTPSATV